eukprot:Opistho-1_new@21450
MSSANLKVPEGGAAKVPAEVTVRVYTGRNIPVKGDKGPFVKIQIGKVKFKTGTSAPGKATAEWNEECKLTAKEKDTELELTVRVGKDDDLGFVIFPLAELPTYSRGKRWHPLLRKKGTPQGEICVDCWASKMQDAKATPDKKSKKSLGMPKDSPLTQSTASLQSMQAQPIVEKAAPSPVAPPKPKESKAEAVPKPPEVTSINPKKGPEEGGTTITIKGSNLGNDLADIVGLTVCGVDALSSVEYVSPNKITCVTPPAKVLGKGTVIVTTASGGTGTCSATFKFKAKEEKKEKEKERDDVSVTADGDHRGDGDTESITSSKHRSASKNSVDALSHSTASESRVRAPEISGVSPNNGPAAGSTAVSIRGDHLGESADDVVSLTICGVDVLSTMQYVSPNLLKCTTKPGSGTGPVVVVTRSGGRGVSSLNFTYNAPLKMRDASVADVEAHKDKHQHQDSSDNPEQWSRTKLLAEVKVLNKRIQELEDENKALLNYVDRLVVRIIEIDPEALMRE